MQLRNNKSEFENPPLEQTSILIFLFYRHFNSRLPVKPVICHKLKYWMYVSEVCKCGNLSTCSGYQGIVLGFWSEFWVSGYPPAKANSISSVCSLSEDICKIIVFSKCMMSCIY
jgi:hypothetical protein